VELVEFGTLSPERYAELVGDEEDPWDAGESRLEWRSKERHVGICDDRGRLIAAAGLVVVDVQFGELDPAPVVGIGGVIVAAAHRGHGLGWSVISGVVERAHELGPRIALLFCRPDRSELYRRHGFAEVHAPVFVDQSTGVLEMPLVTMWRPVEQAVELPAGVVRVRGLLF
jgi:predicted N-acetyltransferase YhbS